MNTNIAWIDVETNGVDAETDVLLEIACLITDSELNILDEKGFSACVYYSPEEVSQILHRTDEFVVNMHNKTDLWNRVSTEGVSLRVLESCLLAYMKKYIPEPKSARLAGNSITLDRNFVNKFLPAVGNHLHYRSFDVSTLAGLANNWYGPEVSYKKKTLHSAFSDITESIEELKFLRTQIFKTPDEFAALGK